MTKEKRDTMRQIAWFNLFIGIYNHYLYAQGGDFIWNCVIGTLNIGVWVFNRDKLSKLNIHWIGNKVEHKRK